MSNLKDVKCKHCAEVIGKRRDNEFQPDGAKGWQRHRRSFAIQCPNCEEWQMFPVNHNTVEVRNLTLKAADWW